MKISLKKSKERAGRTFEIFFGADHRPASQQGIDILAVARMGRPNDTQPHTYL